jgi:hypothetical protein
MTRGVRVVMGAGAGGGEEEVVVGPEGTIMAARVVMEVVDVETAGKSVCMSLGE